MKWFCSDTISSNRYLGGFLGAMVLLTLANQAMAQQASLQLSGSDAVLCHHNTTDWTLTKTSNVGAGPVASGSTVTWTVNAVRGATSSNVLEVNGFVKVTNGGSAPATIGNIVVNLQKKVGNKWVSAAANVANAFNGDAATSANIVAAASQEVAPNGLNYTKSGNVGKFTETAGSGSLSFSDVNSNTIWAITPQQTIPGGGTVDLIFEAEFNNSALNLAAGSQVRAEVIVTFGNAGARGGSGATLTNVDINGNGVIDTDEANVRSVPTRITKDIPALEKCNDSVTVTDAYATDVMTSGTVTTSNPTGFDINANTSTSLNGQVGVKVEGGIDGGQVCNTAHLTSPSSTDSVVIGQQQVGTDPVTGQPVYVPIYYTFTCCEGLDLSATSCVLVEGDLPSDGFEFGDYYTYSQGGYGGNGAPFTLLSTNFAAAFPGGIEVGIPGAGGFSMKFTSAAAVQAYLPAGGPANKLTADLTNPANSSAGVFGGQVLALKINVFFGATGVMTPGGDFGALYFNKPGDSLHGMTVSQILGVMEVALGGGSLPAGYTYGTLNDLAGNLNINAFHEGVVGPFSVYLSKTPPAP